MSLDSTTLRDEEAICSAPTDSRQQLGLFESSSQRSPSEPSSSPSSSEPATSSRAATPSGATPTGSTRRAKAKSTPATAEGAHDSIGAARRTAASAQLRMPRISIGETAPDPYLLIARPASRDECRDQASERRIGNPCPWIGCRYHLLLEVSSAKPRSRGRRKGERRPTTLRLNSRERRRTGRRPGLSPSAAERLVRRWIDDALEQLFSLRWSCALDVVDQYPDGISAPSVGHVLGTSKQNVQGEIDKPHVVDALRSLRRWRTAGLVAPYDDT